MSVVLRIPEDLADLAIPETMADALIVAREHVEMRKRGLMVGGPQIECGCELRRSIRQQNCDYCGLDQSFARPIFYKPMALPETPLAIARRAMKKRIGFLFGIGLPSEFLHE